MEQKVKNKKISNGNGKKRIMKKKPKVKKEKRI